MSNRWHDLSRGFGFYLLIKKEFTMRIFKLIFTLNVLVLLLGISLTVQAQGTTPKSSNFDTPLYATPGPHAIGRTWFSIVDDDGNTVPVVAWYPALKTDITQDPSLTIPNEYVFSNKAFKERLESIGNWGEGKVDAAPENTKIPYPLVIFSVGYNTSPGDYSNIEEHLASYGFVVFSAVYLDEHLNEALWSFFIRRPKLIHNQIDFAEQLNTHEDSFKGFIDTKHIAVVGHSGGGYTALAAAGAQFNLAGFETYCADHPDSVSAQFDCPPVLGHKEEMLALAKLNSMPASVWPSWGDSRVTAIVSQSTPAYAFGSEGLSPVTIPAMIQFGSNDQLVSPEWAGYKTYESISSKEKAEVVFENGNHVIFNQGGGDVVPDKWDMGRAHDLINHFTTAFLLDQLKGDQEAHKALLPDVVSFDNITYATTMK